MSAGPGDGDRYLLTCLVGAASGYNVRSTYICTGGVQEFESLGWKSGTAVHYTMPSTVTMVDLKHRESG